jgi:hypothetical protein
MKFLSRLKMIWNCRREIWLEYKINLDFVCFKKEWRNSNLHNSTKAGCKFDMEKVQVGEGSYGFLNIHCWDNPKEHLKIGKYCSIADNVHFLLGGIHPMHRITTFPYLSHILKQDSQETTGTKGTIIVEDDVWICYGVTILSGVTIGKGSIISAGSIVTKDIPPYSIVINGEVQRKRFSDSIIKRLMKIDLNKIQYLENKEIIKKILNSDITDENIDDILSVLVEKNG